MSTTLPQNHKNIFLRQSEAAVTGKIHGSVGQDKIAPLANRPASDQPYRFLEELRSTDGARPSEHRVPLTAQVRLSVKEEIQRLAKTFSLSVSEVAAAFLERQVQTHIDMQYGALLEPVIRSQIRKDIGSFAERSANLSANAFYAAEQARLLCITALSLLLGADTSVLPGLVTQSQKQAHENLKRHLWQEEEDEEGTKTGEGTP